MKCHYEILNVPQDVDDDELKKAYRKLALKYHPDKNLDNIEEAKQQFQLIQQAYDILSDPQERSWYDRHRDSILKGGLGSDYKDDSLNVYQYFTTTCYSGFGDDDKGFYSVYREVFNTIAAEDSEFDKNLDSDNEVPEFGNSTSSYEDIVHPFYSFWLSYSTKKSYSWLDVYDIRSAPNRRVVRLMEKDNKKVRDKAKKERNEEVRALVAFVRKRDKRVQAQAKLLEEIAIENAKKHEDNRRKQILERKKEMNSYIESEWAKFSNLENELKEIEANLAAEFQEVNVENEASDEEGCTENSHSLYCVACNKLFKTEKAFLNHENSKRHKENMLLLGEINTEDIERQDSTSSSLSHSDCSENSENENSPVFGKDSEFVHQGCSKEPDLQKKKQRKKQQLHVYIDSDCSDTDLDLLTTQGRRNLKKQIVTKEGSTVSQSDAQKVKVKPKNRESKQKTNIEKDENICEPNIKAATGHPQMNKKPEQVKGRCSQMDKNTCCVACNSNFKSKNELFKHLRSSGHSVYIPSESKVNVTNSENKHVRQKKKPK